VFNLGLNNSRPLLKDPQVRQAIQLAIDRQQIVDAVFPTGTQPATSILSHTTPDYEDPQLRPDFRRGQGEVPARRRWLEGGARRYPHEERRQAQA